MTPTQAIAKLTRIATALPVHIATAFNPDLWRDGVRNQARAALEACSFLTDEEKEAEIPSLLGSITVESGTVQNSVIIKMGGVTIFDLHGSNIEAIMNPPPPAKIMEWVRMGKEGDPMGKKLKAIDRNEDGSWKTDEEIAYRVFFAMKRDQDKFFSTDEEGHGALNPTGIVAYSSASRLSPETLQDALLIVLATLRQWIKETLPGEVKWRIETAIEAAA